MTGLELYELYLDTASAFSPPPSWLWLSHRERDGWERLAAKVTDRVRRQVYDNVRRELKAHAKPQ